MVLTSLCNHKINIIIILLLEKRYIEQKNTLQVSVKKEKMYIRQKSYLYSGLSYILIPLTLLRRMFRISNSFLSILNRYVIQIPIIYN